MQKNAKSFIIFERGDYMKFDFKNLSEKDKQIYAIKNRLVEVTGTNVYAVYKKILDMELDYNINYNTLNKTLSLNYTNLDLFSVLAVCRLFNLDTSYIFSAPDSEFETMPSPQNMVDGEKFVVLNDPLYFGKYNGYMYSYNPGSNEIINFDLDIQEGKAVLIYHGKSINHSGEAYNYDVKLEGIPILIRNCNNIFILFTRDSGGFFFLYFDYKKYNKAEMYYRKGILVTNSSLNDKPPMFQNFVLVRNKVLDEKLSLIEGLLKITNDNCFIRKDKLLELKENDEDVTNLFDKCGYIINHELGEYYCINESLILKAVDKNFVPDILKALLKIRNNSEQPGRIIYEDDINISYFAKYHIQNLL